MRPQVLVCGVTFKGLAIDHRHRKGRLNVRLLSTCEPERRLAFDGRRAWRGLSVAPDLPEADQDALEAMKEYLPTLIISDISMSGMTGLEFTRRLRARPVEKGGLIPATALCSLVDHVAGINRQEDHSAA